MPDFVTLDCGCEIHTDGRRTVCPTCADGGPRKNPIVVTQDDVDVAYHIICDLAPDEWFVEGFRETALLPRRRRPGRKRVKR